MNALVEKRKPNPPPFRGAGFHWEDFSYLEALNRKDYSAEAMMVTHGRLANNQYD